MRIPLPSHWTVKHAIQSRVEIFWCLHIFAFALIQHDNKTIESIMLLTSFIHLDSLVVSYTSNHLDEYFGVLRLLETFRILANIFLFFQTVWIHLISVWLRKMLITIFHVHVVIFKMICKLMKMNIQLSAEKIFCFSSFFRNLKNQQMNNRFYFSLWKIYISKSVYIYKFQIRRTLKIVIIANSVKNLNFSLTFTHTRKYTML